MRVRVLADSDQTLRAAAEEIATRAAEAVQEHGRFWAALAGASCAALYPVLAAEPWRERIPWPKVHVVIADEPEGSPEAADSHYGQAYRDLLSRIPMPPGNVIRFFSESGDPSFTLSHFDMMVSSSFQIGPRELPRFDLVLVGLGASGAVASLPEGDEAPVAEGRLGLAVRGRPAGEMRYTLRPDVLDAAARIVVLARGRDPSGAVRELLDGGPTRGSRLSSHRGEVLWLVDHEAAGRSAPVRETSPPAPASTMGAVVPGGTAERPAAAPDPEEERLVSRLRAGDPEAFERLVREHSGRMLAVARRLLPNKEDAQDAVQEAFLAAFKAMPTYREEARLSTWLYRIVVNAALMKLRGRRRHPEEPMERLLPKFLADGHPAEPAVPWRENAEDLLLREEQREMVRQCVDRLPEHYRTALILRDLQDVDLSEAASLLGVTENAVKIRAHRARQALRTMIDPIVRGTSA